MPPTRNLTEGPIARTLFVFALPILAGNVLQSLNGSVNAMWVGHYLGEQALTATANANNILFFLIGAVFGVRMAATILVGQAMGRRDIAQAKRVIGTAYGAALQLWTYVQMPAMAIGAACSSMAAQNVGAQRWDRVSAVTRNGVLFNFLLTGALILPIIIFDHSSLSLFMPAGSASLDIARHLNHIAVWSFLFFGVTFVVSGVVRATGAVIPPLLILGAALWAIRIPFAILLQPRFGIDAIWWSFPASSICAMAMSLAYYRWGRWREARMLASTDGVAVPSEVPAQPPSPVADTCLDITAHADETETS